MPYAFGHEKLIVYHKGMDFVKMLAELLNQIPRRVAACDHLERGAESILINITHASNSWSPKERVVYLGYANGSALECAACLDIFVAKNLLSASDASPAKHQLAEIVNILITMQKTATNRVREDDAAYGTEKDRLFSHENLAVYQISLQLSAWLESMLKEFACSTDLLSKLDKATTAIPLNIAEGAGRFSGTDQAKFYRIAHKATIQSAALVDLAVANAQANSSQIEKGRNQLRRIAAMLSSLSKAVTKKINT